MENELVIGPDEELIEGTMKEGYPELYFPKYYIELKVLSMRQDKAASFVYTVQIEEDLEVDIHVHFDAPYFNTIPVGFKSLWLRRGPRYNQLIAIVPKEKLNVLGAVDIRVEMGPDHLYLSNGLEISTGLKVKNYSMYQDKPGFIQANMESLNAHLSKPTVENSKSIAYYLDAYKKNCTFVLDSIPDARYVNGKSVKTYYINLDKNRCSICGSKNIKERQGTMICNNCDSRIPSLLNRCRNMVLEFEEEKEDYDGFEG